VERDARKLHTPLSQYRLAYAGIVLVHSAVTEHVCVASGATEVVVVVSATHAEPDSVKPERQPVSEREGRVSVQRALCGRMQGKEKAHGRSRRCCRSNDWRCSARCWSSRSSARMSASTAPQ